MNTQSYLSKKKKIMNTQSQIKNKFSFFFLQWLEKFNGDACILVPYLLVRFCGVFLCRFRELCQNWNYHLFFLILFDYLVFLYSMVV